MKTRLLYVATIGIALSTHLPPARAGSEEKVHEVRAGDRVLSRDDQQKLNHARQLNAKAIALVEAGRLSEALKLAQEALAIRKELLGEKHADVAHSLFTVANLYHAQTNYAKAEPLYRQALDIQREVLGERHPSYAMSLNNLAMLYRAQGNDAKAEPLYLQALKIRKEVLGERHPAYAHTLNNLAVLYYRQGNYAKAEPLHREALDIRRAVLGAKHPEVADSLNNLALLHTSQGNYAKAEPLYLQALDIRKEVFGAKHPSYAQSLSNLAFLYQSGEDFGKAEPLYRQALDIRRAVHGEKHPDYANNLNSLAGLYYSQKNYAKAEPLFRQALDIRRALHGEKHADYAASLHNLANLYRAQGNYANAEPLFRQALDILKEVLGEKHPNVAQVLQNLSDLYMAQGDYARAERLLRQAMDIQKDGLGERHPDYARSLNFLAGVYHLQRNYALAEPLYRQALAIQKEVLGERHPAYARNLNNLAGLCESRRNYAMAEALYRQALLASQVGTTPIPCDDLQPHHLRAHPDSVVILDNHSLALRDAAARDFSAKALRLCDRSFVLALAVLERVRQENIDQQQDKMHLAADRFDLFPHRISVLHSLFALEKTPEDLQAAVATAEQGSARAFLESLGRNRVNRLAGVSPALQTQEQELLEEIRLLDLRIDKESSRTLDKRSPQLVGQLLAQRGDAEANLAKLIALMEKEHPQYAALRYPRPCKLDDARACLAADEIALLFVPGTKESFVVLVEGQPNAADMANGLAIVPLPTRAVLADHVAGLNDLDTLALPARAKALGRDAFDAILGPCKQRIDGKSLVIVPLDSLGQLPFELLIEEDGKYLVEKHRIRYAPSLTALHLINLWKQKRAAPETPLFAVGDPIYEAADPRAAKSGRPVDVASASKDTLRDLQGRQGTREGLKRLVHSGNEVATIARLLGARSEHVLTGEDASEAKVKAASAADQMAKARYVHFSTHGILGVDISRQPALVLNLVGNTGNNGFDGFLEYPEILNLKLNADLVVLSACRTGQGRMARGEGVTGLARAFLYAGSKGVVCSLWSVDDQETANLMVDFYSHLKKGCSAAEALREAQLAMIRAGKAPLYWAPFILIGE